MGGCEEEDIFVVNDGELKFTDGREENREYGDGRDLKNTRYVL